MTQSQVHATLHDMESNSRLWRSIAACHSSILKYDDEDSSVIDGIKLATCDLLVYCTELAVLKLAFSRCCGKSTTLTLSSSTRFAMLNIELINWGCRQCTLAVKVSRNHTDATTMFIAVCCHSLSRWCDLKSQLMMLARVENWWWKLSREF